MKAVVLALAMTLATAAAAAAGDCEDGLARLDTALASGGIDPDVQAQAQDMRNQASELCKAGNEEEGADVLNEAAALLGIE